MLLFLPEDKWFLITFETTDSEAMCQSKPRVSLQSKSEENEFSIIHDAPTDTWIKEADAERHYKCIFPVCRATYLILVSHRTFMCSPGSWSPHSGSDTEVEPDVDQCMRRYWLMVGWDGSAGWNPRPIVSAKEVCLPWKYFPVSGLGFQATSNEC